MKTNFSGPTQLSFLFFLIPGYSKTKTPMIDGPEYHGDSRSITLSGTHLWLLNLVILLLLKQKKLVMSDVGMFKVSVVGGLSD